MSYIKTIKYVSNGTYLLFWCTTKGVNKNKIL